MKLRHAGGSPFVRKVMVIAHEHGLVDRIELVPTTVSPVEANENLAGENPLMKVPSLVTDDGQVLFDSPVICEYLDSLSGKAKFFPASGPQRWSALCQQALGDGVLDALILCRYEATRPEDKRWSGWVDAQRKKAYQGLAAAEKENLAGAPTIGHVTFACMFGYLDFRFPDDGWRNRHPKLAAWYKEFEKLPSMQATRPPAA
ncbi:MAG TPA: glutathione S-transferase [Stellaceae bacterium]|jgi:glutathione S-transferase|nr:glutathione S-transferase [Stellaceae bacterium]